MSPDVVLKKQVKMMKLHNGQMTLLESDIILGNGIKIMTDGTIIKKDGSKMMMKEGQYINLSEM